MPGKPAPTGSSGPSVGADCIKSASLVIKSNAISGGKGAAEADFTTKYLIPKFTEAEKAKGNNISVSFQGDGAEDEQYKTKVSLDLKTGGGADLISLDGIWVGEFAEAGYIKPLDDVIGADQVKAWDGWSQIPASVQKIVSYKDKIYGLPGGTDGRVIFFNKTLFAKAGLPADWQPTSWQEVLDAGAKLKNAGVQIPIQLNAGTAMGEATTMQGILPLLVGAGAEMYSNGKWLGNTPQLRQALQLYSDIYQTDSLGDPLLQQEQTGREKSFADFAKGQVGMLFESDYFWRGVVEPKNGVAPMPDREKVVGWAKIPAVSPGKGVAGADFVTMSGGGGRVINPNTKCPAAAWELLTFVDSKEVTKASLAGEAKITARTDVNDEVLAGDPMLSFVAKDILPITHFRPGAANYTQVSQALQEATGAVASGKSVDQAAKGYEAALEKAVGKENVTTG